MISHVGTHTDVGFYPFSLYSVHSVSQKSTSSRKWLAIVITVITNKVISENATNLFKFTLRNRSLSVLLKLECLIMTCRVTKLYVDVWDTLYAAFHCDDLATCWVKPRLNLQMVLYYTCVVLFLSRFLLNGFLSDSKFWKTVGININQAFHGSDGIINCL